MIRFYHMALNISGYERQNTESLIESANSEWNFDDDGWSGDIDLGGLYVSGEHFLYNESVDEFVDRLVKAIWRANGKSCDVRVDATELPGQPDQSMSRSQEDYHRLMGD